MKDPEVAQVFRPLIKKGFCLRCKIQIHLDPEKFQHALHQANIIDGKECETFRLSMSSVPQMLDTFQEWREPKLSSVKSCIVNAIQEKAPALAHVIQHSDFHIFWNCDCKVDRGVQSMTSAADRKVIDCCSGSWSLSGAEAGPEDKLSLITRASAEIARLLTFGRWDDFKTYVQLLKQRYPGDNDVKATVIGHEILSSYCCGNPRERLLMSGEFKSCVRKAKCENFITLYFRAIETGIYRATGHMKQADYIITAALQKGQLFGANKAMAFLYERQGLNSLPQDRYMREYMSPYKSKDLEAAASSMMLAYKIYNQIAENVKDRQDSQLYELVFWPLIEFVCTRLGTCTTGAFFNPAGVIPNDWDEIEEAVAELRKNFRWFSPRRKAYFYLMYSDYYRRRAERAENIRDVNSVDMWFESCQRAEKAKDTAINNNLKSEFCDYAQRRIDYLKVKVQNGHGCKFNQNVLTNVPEASLSTSHSTRNCSDWALQGCLSKSNDSYTHENILEEENAHSAAHTHYWVFQDFVPSRPVHEWPALAIQPGFPHDSDGSSISLDLRSCGGSGSASPGGMASLDIPLDLKGRHDLVWISSDEVGQQVSPCGPQATLYQKMDQNQAHHAHGDTSVHVKQGSIPHEESAVSSNLYQSLIRHPEASAEDTQESKCGTWSCPGCRLLDGKIKGLIESIHGLVTLTTSIHDKLDRAEEERQQYERAIEKLTKENEALVGETKNLRTEIDNLAKQISGLK